MEQYGRGESVGQGEQGGQTRAGEKLAAGQAVGDRGGRGGAPQDAERRTEPRAWRRPGSGKPHADRRGAGHRQVHPAAAEHPVDTYAPDTVCVGRGKRGSAQVARRPSRQGVGEHLHPVRDQSQRHLHADREREAGADNSRFNPDRHVGRDRVGRRERVAGARMRRLVAALCQGERRAGNLSGSY